MDTLLVLFIGAQPLLLLIWFLIELWFRVESKRLDYLAESIEETMARLAKRKRK